MTLPSKAPYKPKADRAELRAQRLHWTVQASALWLLTQGVLLCLLNTWISDRVSLRYMDLMVPYIRMAGLAYVCLGLYLLSAARDPRHQYLAVDLLILFLIGQAYFTLNYKLGGFPLNTWELFSLCVNLALGILLTVFRTRSTEMDTDAGTLWSLTAKEWLIALSKKSHRNAPLPAPIAASAPAPEHPAPEPAKDHTTEAEKNEAKRRSQSLPHMD